VKDQIISVAVNIGGGLIAAFIYDWMRGRQRTAQAPSAERGRAAWRGAGERPPAGAPAGPRLFGALLIIVLLAAAGFAAAVMLHRMGLGAARPGLDALIRQGAIIGLSMLVFVWLLGRLRRR
jgi:hypothetical protein